MYERDWCVGQVGSRIAASSLPYDPGIHEYDLGGERISVVSAPEIEVSDRTEDQVLHLVQDEETIAAVSYTHLTLPTIYSV